MNIMRNSSAEELSAPRRGIMIKVLLFGLALVAVIASIVFFVLKTYGRNDNTLHFTYRVIVITVISAYAVIGLFLYGRSRTMRCEPDQRVILIATISDYATDDATVIRAVDPRIEAAFWRTQPKCSTTCPSDRVCSVCLSTVDPMKPGALGSGQAACCNGWFHKHCVLQYWQSNEGIVICPNCRHDRSKMSI